MSKNIQRRIAFVLLAIWIGELFRPTAAFALTSGPVQPEVQGFQPAGVAEMVDLQSGDFKYNLPLLDIDGYPLNLTYQSGGGMEDEASWVGFGWSLNPGAINRQVRGIADDMNGDQITTDHYTKPMVTIGGRFTGKTEVVGIGTAKQTGDGNTTSPASLAINASYGAYINNYTGVGVELGVNAGMSFGRDQGGPMTGALGFGLTSDSQKGVDVSPYSSLSMADLHTSAIMEKAGLSASLGYNTRSGIKSMSLGSSFGTSIIRNITGPSSITYNTEPISPKIQTPYSSRAGSFSIDLGASLAVIFTGGGFTGYVSKKEVKHKTEQLNKSYGFLYAEKGKNIPEAVMDFVRENENPVIPELPNLALPIATPDLFSFSSQVGSGQFRLYRGGTGVFFDTYAEDESDNTTLGLDLGGSPLSIHTGVTFYNQDIKTTTGKWVKDNNYLSFGDFQDELGSTPAHQHAYFKVLGELNKQDATVAGLLNNTALLTPKLNGSNAEKNFYEKTVGQKIIKQQREVQQTTVSFLTVAQVKNGGLDTEIKVYEPTPEGAPPAQLTAQPKLKTNYIPPARSSGHIAEMTVTQGNGKRLIYGVPVYNTKHEEYSFAIGNFSKGEYQLLNPGIVKLENGIGTKGAQKGIDHYFHKESKPPYASAYLLTAVLSPDYVDRTGDGITNDDLGTAIKFNYSKSDFNYRWRAPYAGATVNRGLLADPDDDKASIVYGEKELYYISSIATKTKIAYFITKDREDGLGVTGVAGGKDVAQKQKCLTEIRLYSKADMSRPIKVVKFKYNYSICPGVLNHAGTGGKLTLEKIWFEYGNVEKGQFNPYIFSYKDPATPYAHNTADRWGSYKPESGNPGGLTNEEYPYSLQDPGLVNGSAGVWQLNKIELPTGGTIHVTYESDDYAYVQNRQAMTMRPIQQLEGTTDDERKVIDANGIKVALSDADIPPGSYNTPDKILEWFRTNLLSGSRYLYTRLKVKIDPSGNAPADFISCYVEVTGVDLDRVGKTATFRFSNITDGGVTASPMAIAAWQKMKNEYPQYAYPGYDNRQKADAAGTVKALVSAVLSSIGNISELIKPFYSRAKGKGLAGRFYNQGSFVRLTKRDGHKLGGGSRVKKIYINDDWGTMSRTSADPSFSASYGQAYEYLTEDGKSSSGVASYEPAIGNDENPFKQPVFYTQKIKGAINNYISLEEPFGESLFPAPVVTYSRVRVVDLDKNEQADPGLRTGYTVHEFYTTKDFPVRVKRSQIKTDHPKPGSYYSLIKTVSIDELFMSQGYLVMLNDMNGKLKATRIYNQANVLISGTEYFYKCNTDGPGQYSLNNTVKVVSQDGSVSDQVLGQDVEMFTDYREQECKNSGHTFNGGADTFMTIIPWTIPHLPYGQNVDYRLFRSACAVKTVQSYGILDRVVKTENGSSISVENLAFDGVTGAAIVTRTQNEFKKPVYSVNIPAYWAYTGMGGAYQNLGMMISGLETTANQGVIITDLVQYIAPGDIIEDLSDPADIKLYWVVEKRRQTQLTDFDVLYLMDRLGKIKAGHKIKLGKIIRSGYRNILDAQISNFTCLNNPIIGGHLRFADNVDLSTLKIINTSASEFDENWVSEVPDIKVIEPPDNFDWRFDEKEIVALPGLNGYRAAKLVKSEYNNLKGWKPEVVGEEIETLENSGYFWSTKSYFRMVKPHYLDAGSRLYFYANVDIPETKDYFIGFDSNIPLTFGFDHGPNITEDFALSSGRKSWFIVKYHLEEGQHVLRMELKGDDIQIPENAGFGIEIYNNSESEIRNHENINFIWNTVHYLVGNYPYGLTDAAYITNAMGKVTHARYRWTDAFELMDQTPYTPLNSPNKGINPYIYGLKGNWRLSKTKIFEGKRAYQSLTGRAVDVKNAGYLNNFYPNWYAPVPYSEQKHWLLTGNANWITANKITQYDNFGQQLENKDALGRYSAAKFCFNGELPAAVASNAMQREIYAESFEDNRFIPGRPDYVEPNPPPYFTPVVLSDQISHSGNNSCLLYSDGLVLKTRAFSIRDITPPLLTVNPTTGEYNKYDGVGHYPNGFEPLAKTYIFNAWVKDNAPFNRSEGIKLFNGNDQIALTVKAVVEGWKLVEGKIPMDAYVPAYLAANNLPGFTYNNEGVPIKLKIKPNGTNIYIDDIRIHPQEATMKTYAYDEKTMRLMAELDENCFATFYEYDDQGLLIRVKKETEKGIATLKESRSSYKRKQ